MFSNAFDWYVLVLLFSSFIILILSIISQKYNFIHKSMKSTILIWFFIEIVIMQTLHNIRITPDYSGAPTISNEAKAGLQSAIDYYSSIIKVKQVTTNNVVYSSSTQCSIGIPSFYKTTGFDPSVTDMMIIVYESPYTTTWQKFFGVSCKSSVQQWPTYGVIVYNTLSALPYQQKNINKIMLHQLTHILGISSNYLSILSPSSYKVIQNGRIGIVSPNTLNYINNFFGCEQANGVLFSNQTFQQYQLAHWDSLYDKELLNGKSDDLEITPLTLNALKDIQFYDEVTINTSNDPSSSNGCDQSNDGNSSNLGLILGLAIPLSVLLIIILISLVLIGCYFYHKSRQAASPSLKGNNSQKHQTIAPTNQQLKIQDN